MCDLKKWISIIGLGCLVVCQGGFAQTQTSVKPIEPSNIASYQGHPLNTLLNKMPPNLVNALLLKIKIKGLSNGVTGFQGVDDEAISKYNISKLQAVGADVGEEDLMQLPNSEQYKDMLEKQACIVDLFPTNMNFSVDVENWGHYILCVQPTQSIPVTSATTT